MPVETTIPVSSNECWMWRMMIVLHVPLVLLQHRVNFVLKAVNMHKGSRADLLATFLQGKAEWSVFSHQMVSNKLCCFTAHPSFTGYGDTPCLEPSALISCKLTHAVVLYLVSYLLTTLSFDQGMLRSALRAKAWSVGTVTLKPPCWRSASSSSRSAGVQALTSSCSWNISDPPLIRWLCSPNCCVRTFVVLLQAFSLSTLGLVIFMKVSG